MVTQLSARWNLALVILVVLLVAAMALGFLALATHVIMLPWSHHLTACDGTLMPCY
jgi:hypothetical protein